MRKRSGGGGGGGGGRGPLSTSLHRHMKTFDRLNISTIEQIVDYLQCKYPYHYSPSRTKAKTLLTQVRAALARIKRHETKPLISDDEDDAAADEDDGGGDFSRKKKPRRAAKDAEERLQRLEEERLRKIRRQSDSEEDSDSDSDGGVSTSEDAVYGEKLPPRVDLLKMQLRESNKKAGETKNVELETPGREKKATAAELSIGGGGKASSSGGAPVGSGSGGDGDGPRFSDLGGMKEVLKELEMEVMVPLHQGKLLRWLGVRPISGILLSGPPGCGKTRLAHAIANEAGLPFYKISATEVVSGVSGASEEYLRDLFSKAQRTAPSIIFIDEIDAIGAKREGLQREMERRIVTQLLTCMDESHRPSVPIDLNLNPESTDSAPGYVLVIGATNRPDALDPALRRPGRFDREIVLGVPDEYARVEILSVFTKSLRLEGSFDLQKIAKSTPGFVGADLKALVNKAGNLAMRRIVGEIKPKVTEGCADNEQVDTKWWKEPLLPEEMEKLAITMQDFKEAVDMVQPSSKREGFSAIPNVKWDDVGGLDVLRQEFDRYIVRRIKHPKEYEGFGVDLETGFLLYGPPGCGKTLIAKAVANESGANFIHIKGPELLSKFVGDSELAVRTLFSRARTCAPCVLFFDEVDALTTRRGSDGGWVVERLLNQLLIELDGAEQRRGVFVIGATNRPDVMDKALIRPGRFGKQLYVPLPTPLDRGLILRAVSRKKPIDSSVDFNAVAQMEACEHFSGADLAALANEAAMAALEENLMSMGSNSGGDPCTIKTTHFEKAATRIKPSVTIEQRHDYKKLLSKIIGA